MPRDDGVHDEFQTFKAEMSIAVSKQAQLEVIVPIALGPFGLGAKDRPQLHVAALSIVRLGFAIEYAKHAHQISESIRRATVNPVRLLIPYDAAGLEIARQRSHRRAGISHEATSASLRWLAI